MALTDIQCKKAKAVSDAGEKLKSRKISDGSVKGLYLEVTDKGSKYWRLKYRILGKEKRLSIGVYPAISLAKARKLALEAREQVAEGIDPSIKKRIQKDLAKVAAENSFKAIALEWFENWKGGKVTNSITRTKGLLNNWLLPTIGNIPITEITPPELLRTLKKIENSTKGGSNNHYMAKRAKELSGQIFKYAIATGRAFNNPSRDIGIALKPHQVKHFSSITEPRKIGKLMLAMDSYDGGIVVKTALHLSAYIFCRPIEIRRLEWKEINWEESRIEFPAEKMKMREPLMVPMCTQVVALLQNIQQFTGSGKYVFPSQRGQGRPMSENAVRLAIRSLGYGNDDMTPHGFRAMARTALAEQLEYPSDWIEAQLAHAVSDANGRAYNRTLFIKQRTKMMQDWADYLDYLRDVADGTNVIYGDFKHQA